jgi:hypothetical protein
MCIGKDGSGRWPLKLLLGAAYCDCEHKVTVWLSHGRRSLSTMINRELDGTRKTADIDEAQHLLLHGRKRTIHPHCTHRQSCPRKQHLPTCNPTRYMRWRSAGERHSPQRQRRDRNRQLDPKWRPEDPAPDPPPGPSQGPQRHKKNVLQILYVFERSDGRRHPAHVGPRLGSPTPCT